MKQCLVAISSFLAIISIVFAIPQVISLDGYLTNASGTPLNGSSYSFVFSIYNQTPGGTALWTETQILAVSSGKLNALLGSVTALNLLFNQDYYLGVKVGTDSEMSPRYRVSSSAYAYTAQNLASNATAGGNFYVSGNASIGASGQAADRLEVSNDYSLTSAYRGITLMGGHSGDLIERAGVAIRGYNSSNANAFSLINGRASSTDNYLQLGGGGLYGPTRISFMTAASLNAVGAERMAIDSSGNVGIGTTSPETKLHVAENSASDAYTLFANNDLTANNGIFILFRGKDSAGYPSNYAGIRTKMISHTSGSQNAQLEFYVVNAAGSIASSKLTIAQNGAVTIPGTLSKGGGSFLIDDPLDPQNKILQHSFVESPDMKNIYDGTVSLNSSGEAAVEMPAYFEALNKDFRYQLTPIGASMPNLFVKQKISQNRFTISGGVPGGEVSWQVTGTRKDAFAEQNRIIVEQKKGVGNDYKKGECIHKEACEQGRTA